MRRPIKPFAVLLAAFLSALSPACPQQSEKRQPSASICSIQRLHEICEPAVCQAHVIHLFFKAVMIHSFFWMTNYREHLKKPSLKGKHSVSSLHPPAYNLYYVRWIKEKKWPSLNRCKEKITLKITLLGPQIPYTLHSQFQIRKSYPYTYIYIYLYVCICEIQWVRWKLLIPSQEIC